MTVATRILPINSLTQLDQPAWCCDDCGCEYGRRLPEIATYHMDTCGVCLEHKSVTQPLDFGYLRPEWTRHWKESA